jgi:hypothetical protein
MQNRRIDGRVWRRTGGIATVSLGMLLITAALASAQDKPPASGTGGGNASAATGKQNPAEKRVSLEAENIPLTQAIKTIMQSARADYVVDSALRGATVTAHLTDVKLSVVLATLMKVSSLPVTYRLEDGIYHFVPRIDPPEPPPSELPTPQTPPEKPWRMQAIRVVNVDAGELAQILGGNMFSVGGDHYGVLDAYNLDGSWGNGTMSGSYSYSNGHGTGGYSFGPGGVILGSWGSGLNGITPGHSINVGPFHFNF